MKTLVVIDNNLKHDNRVRRHITALLERGHAVDVLARPVPNAVAGFAAPGMTMAFWPPPEITLDQRVIRTLSQQLGLTRQLFAAFPAALVSSESLDVLGPLSERIQSRQLACRSWTGFRGAIFREDLHPVDDYQSVLWYFEFMLRWAEYACRFEADCVYCNDLLTLFAGVAHKTKYGSRLIFDAHEIYYDMGPGMHSRLWKQAMALLERQLVASADAIIGVSQSHVEWMRTAYRPACELFCVPNCVGMGEVVSPPEPHSPGSPLRIYYHGASDAYRGLDKIVRAVAEEPATQFIMRCFPSPTLDEVGKLVEGMALQERVRLLPLASAEEMIHAIRTEADVGIHAHESPQALNIKVCLSNKFIEYLLAGIPIITSPLEEQARIVREQEIGYVLADNSPAEIRKGLAWALDHRHRFAEIGQRAYEEGLRRFSWPAIKDTLLKAVG
jgi:glycosyltransferase involved in cell wall biosynthesis